MSTKPDGRTKSPRGTGNGRPSLLYDSDLLDLLDQKGSRSARALITRSLITRMSEAVILRSKHQGTEGPR